MDTDKQQNNSRVIGKPFVKGVSGNPLGRPKKGQAITELLNEYLESKEEGEEITIKQRVVKKVVDLALKGNPYAIKLIFAYVDGLPTQRQEITGDKENFTFIIKNNGYRNPIIDKN